MAGCKLLTLTVQLTFHNLTGESISINHKEDKLDFFFFSSMMDRLVVETAGVEEAVKPSGCSTEAQVCQTCKICEEGFSWFVS